MIIIFDKIELRTKIVLVWIISFVSLWLIFQVTFPLKTMKIQLDKIEKGITNNDWKQAKAYADQFADTFRRKRFIIQINNATEIFTAFELTIGELEETVQHKQENALEHVGALRETLNLVVKPFSGP